MIGLTREEEDERLEITLHFRDQADIVFLVPSDAIGNEFITSLRRTINSFMYTYVLKFEDMAIDSPLTESEAPLSQIK